MKKNNWLLLFMIGLSQALLAQDSLAVLNSEQVLLLVKKYHPVARQAQIGVLQSNANVTLTRGAFNPIIGGYLAQKNFSQIEYYNLTNAQIIIPTWYGIEQSPSRRGHWQNWPGLACHASDWRATNADAARNP